MSFINLLGNDVFSSQDIDNRTEAILRSQYSQQEEDIINRKVSGMMLGQYTMSTDEQLELAQFAAAVFAARAENAAARADMALLNKVLAYELVKRQLDSYVDEVILEGDTADVIASKNAFNTDNATKRVPLQATLDAYDQATKDLYALRNPAPPVGP